MPTTKELLKQLREMEKIMTKGEWVHNGNVGIGFREFKTSIVVKPLPMTECNMAGIAALRNNIIPLLDEIERLQGENERLKKEVVELACRLPRFA